MHRLPKNTLNIILHIGASTPLALIVWDFSRNALTVNPIQEITLRTGKTALILLLLSLSCTLLNTLVGYKQAIALRKPLGLYAFFYAGLHVLIFIGLDYGFDLRLISQVMIEKQYALAGLAAFLLLMPLAITSTKGWRRRLGKTWKRLHRLVYIAAPLVIVHYLWLVKSDIREPLLYGIVLGLLLLARLPSIRSALNRLYQRSLNKHTVEIESVDDHRATV